MSFFSWVSLRYFARGAAERLDKVHDNQHVVRTDREELDELRENHRAADFGELVVAV